MDTIRLGLGYRALRQRRRLTQAQLGAKARVSGSVICRIERGHADRVAAHTLDRVAAALDARIDVRLLWHGEGLDRLLDARHARLVDLVLNILTSSDWELATEVSFNVYGERGSIDILAFHPATGCLLVIEIKSVVPDMQSMLAALDRKGRLARSVRLEAASATQRSNRTAPSRGSRGDIPDCIAGSDGRGPPLARPASGLDLRRHVCVRCVPGGDSSTGASASGASPLRGTHNAASRSRMIEADVRLANICQEWCD